jgi:ribosomal 30S subunit maturation factor RimM
MDTTNFPREFKTLEDYEKAATSFVIPFLEDRALKIAETLQELYNLIDSDKELSPEDTDFYINHIMELVSFTDPKNPTYPYFKGVLDLEERLNAEGAFLTKEATP